MPDRAQLYLHTLRHLLFSQILWRLWYTARRKLGLYRIPRYKSAPDFDRACLRRLREFLQASGNHGIHEGADMEALRNQDFRLLNRPAENIGRIPWRDPVYPRLWRYQLHGFRFAREFAVNAVMEIYLGDRDRALNWMHDWIRENPPGNDVSWDAGPVSERLVNWTLLIAAFDIQEEEIRVAYLRQVRWLKKWLEYDLRANHLLRNACALVLAELVLGNVSGQDKALPLLYAQVKEQILPDGGHFERSPMYHALALWDMLVVHAAFETKPFFLEETVRDMTTFLDTVRHPDGEIPLFGDSVLHQAPATATLVALARERVSMVDAAKQSDKAGQALRNSGFYVLGSRSAKECMIVKTAPPLPSYQPGHSHADMLSYELSLEGLRFIVDSGVHGYAESPLREYSRSTRAHNTAQLDDLDQSEMWGVFRVARRPLACPVVFEADDAVASIEAHCRYPQGPSHQRTIRYGKKDSSWEIHDHMDATSDRHVLKSYIHFHPRCEVLSEGDRIMARRETILAQVELMSPGSIELLPGSSSQTLHWYCPEFGSSQPCTVAILRSTGDTTLDISYKIRLTKAAEC